MKTVLIDYLSPGGHLPIINFYIKNLGKCFDIIYLNNKVRKNILAKNKINYINLKKNFFLRFFQMLGFFLSLKKKNINRVVMLSYEPQILFFLSFFIDLSYFKIFVFEHDTLNEKNYFKFLFIKHLNKNITHLAYTDTQIKLLNKIFKKKAIFTNHPIIENKKNINYIKKEKFKKKIILIPTRHHFIKDLIENFIKKNLNYQFYVLAKKNNLKKKIFSNFNNVKLIEFIKEKDINKVIAIYLPLDPEIYKYRVSAWLYMGIAYNKKILMENNDLYKFEKKRFPNYIVLNNNKIFNNFNSFVKKKINISKYNSLLITNLKKSIFGKIKIDN